MLTAFRRYLETWPVRVFFGIMVMAFVVWGVGDVVRQIGTRTWVAKAGGQTIEPVQFQGTFQRIMSQAQQRLPPGQDVTPALRKQVADRALDQMVGQIAVNNEIARLRLAVPDAALRAAVFALPEFRGPSGEFDRSRFDSLLRANGIGEPQFLDMMRGQLAAQQLVGAVTAGVTVPPVLAKSVYAFEQEKRSAQMVEVPFASEPEPPAPTEAELQRWYATHPWLYQVPEFRRVKAVVLTAETLAKTLTSSDEELAAYYEAHKADFVVPAKRSIQVAVLHDEVKAKALATTWQGGADWAAVQKEAEAGGGSAVALDNTTEDGIPDPALAKAAFAATVDQVSGPVQTPLGWDVLKVTQASGGSNKTLADVKDQVREQVLAQKATSQIYDVVNKVDDVLGTGAGLEKLPNGVGLVGVQGTMDAEGKTTEGQPAPIPGPPELKSALVTAAFKTPEGQVPAQLTEVPLPGSAGSAYYAVEVEQITPAKEKPLSDVKDQVTAAWAQETQRKAAEQQAAKMLAAVQDGQSLADAAAVAGLTMRETPLVGREGDARGVPDPLVHALFSLKPKEPTMVQTDEEFIVAVPAKTEVPDPAQDKAAYDGITEALNRSLTTDVTAVFAKALRERANPRINQPVFDNFVNGQ